MTISRNLSILAEGVRSSGVLAVTNECVVAALVHAARGNQTHALHSLQHRCAGGRRANGAARFD